MSDGEPGAVRGTSDGPAWARVWRLAQVRAGALLSKWQERRVLSDEVAAATVEHLLLREAGLPPHAWLTAELGTRLRRIVHHKAQELLRERERERDGARGRSRTSRCRVGPNQAVAVTAHGPELPHTEHAEGTRSQPEARAMERLTPVCRPSER